MKPEDIVITSKPPFCDRTEVRASIVVTCSSGEKLADCDAQDHKRIAYLLRRGVSLRLYGWVLDLVNNFRGGPEVFAGPLAQEKFIEEVRNPINRLVESLMEPTQRDLEVLSEADLLEKVSKLEPVNDAVPQPGMNTGEGESPESSVPASRGDVGSNPTCVTPLCFRTKPIEVEAFQATRAARADNADWPQWMHEAWQKDHREVGSVGCEDHPNSDGTDRFQLCAAEGYWLNVPWDDWLIRFPDGEVCIIPAEKFDEHFEPA